MNHGNNAYFDWNCSNGFRGDFCIIYDRQRWTASDSHKPLLVYVRGDKMYDGAEHIFKITSTGICIIY